MVWLPDGDFTANFTYADQCSTASEITSVNKAEVM